MSNVRVMTTDFLVLRKTPYADTSLVVAGIAPDVGQVHFLVRGGRRLGRRQFPLVDLFRVLCVQFREGRGELRHWSAADLKRQFPGMARDLQAFQCAGWLARFALANVVEGVAHPRFFEAMLTALGRLEAAALARRGVREATGAATIGACLVYLDEAGLLPDYAAEPATAERVQVLLEAGVGGDLPKLNEAAWQRLRTWVMELLEHAECSVAEPRDSSAVTGGPVG